MTQSNFIFLTKLTAFIFGFVIAINRMVIEDYVKKNSKIWKFVTTEPKNVA